MYNILICDDEPDIVSALKIYLASDGYGIYEAYNGREAIEMMQKTEIHLVLMDIMMPEMDGIQTMVKIRENSNVPVIFLTAKSEDNDKVLGLMVGADDYITKPFSPNELVARVKAHLNRYIRLTRKRSDENEYIEYPGLKIDRTARRVFVDGEERCFTTKEFDLLTYLATHPNHVFSKDELFSAVWGMDSMGEIATVTVHIKKIRKKTENSNVKTGYIETVWGAGYRFRVLNGKVDEEKESVINAI